MRERERGREGDRERERDYTLDAVEMSDATGWQRLMGSLIFIGHLSQK